jgi:diguanylate cyclase (GGDEF)-like protein
MVCLMIVVGVFGLAQLHAVNKVAAEMREGWLPRIEVLGELKRDLQQHFHQASRRLQTTDTVRLASVSEEGLDVSGTVSSAAETYQSMMSAPEERELFDEFQDHWEHYLLTERVVFSLIDAGDEANAITTFNIFSNGAFSAATDRLDQLIAYAKRKSRESTTYAREIYHQAVILIAAVMTFGGVCALIAVAWSQRHVTAPILGVANAMSHLTSGDLNLTVNDDRYRGDEIGTLIASVTAYRNSLKRGRELAATADLERRRLQSAVDNMPIGLCMFDGAKQLIVCNAHYAEMFGLPPEACHSGTPLETVLNAIQDADGGLRDGVTRTLNDLKNDEQSGQPLTRLMGLGNGRTISVIYRAMSDGGWVAIHEDVTERQRAEERIAHMAHHDALTNLPNRVLFHRKLVQALRRTQRNGQVGVLCLDLDRFKNINDTLGHPVGDRLLVQVASRLRDCVSDVDTVARLGGDEFAIVQASSSQPDGANALAERLIPAISQPYDIDGQTVLIGASIGIAIAPNHGADADPLLACADLALYEAKNQGRGIHRIFEDTMALRMTNKRAIELDLRQALDKDEFNLFYQPFVHLETGEIRGFEALLRWYRADGTMTSPADFIPLAEEIGLIVPLGAWILEKACAEAAGWPEDIRVAANVSAVQLGQGDFVRTVETILSRTGLDPERLEIEITETALLDDSCDVLDKLHRLRDMGVQIALDDFGIGYSSLSYLRTFPFQRIKIDGSFIRSVARQDGSLAIIRAVTGLGAALGMETTAEGVESEAQLGCLQAEGCTEVQGYLFSRPVPAENVSPLLDGFHRRWNQPSPSTMVESHG